jgi:transposase
MTCHQYNLPAFNKRLAYKANRAGVADHFAGQDPVVVDMVESDLATIDHLDGQISKLELIIAGRAKRHDAGGFYRLRSIDGVGKVLALTMLYEIHDIGRFPRVQDFLSYCRLVRGRKESAGKRCGGGSSGKKIGNAHLKWAFSVATVLFMRQREAAKRFVERKARRYGKAKAISILSAKLGRAVYFMLRDGRPFDEDRFFGRKSTAAADAAATADATSTAT